MKCWPWKHNWVYSPYYGRVITWELSDKGISIAREREEIIHRMFCRKCGKIKNLKKEPQ